MEGLLERFPADYLGKRLRMQVEYVARLFGSGRVRFHPENCDILFRGVETVLRGARVWQRCLENATRFSISQTDLTIVDLPAGFDGLRVLHLSDLHMDVPTQYGVDFTVALARTLSDLDFDLAVLTGDFRFRTAGPYSDLRRHLEILMPRLDCPLGVFGILGNHDFIEQLTDLEDVGVRMLVNESVMLERKGDRVWLIGVDDPHFYGTHDFQRALADVPHGVCRLMLVHSPEIGEEAAAHRGAIYLCGHTHGGQLCLPGGVAPITLANCPKERRLGQWSLGTMVGYTSAGCGSSGLPARLNCPPEIAIHTLRAPALL